MKILSLIISILFTFTIHAKSQSYYVDGVNGNNVNAGTSLANAWKTIQKAFDAAVPGSVTYIRGGTYNAQLTMNVSGIAANPIEFRNYQNDTVLIDGTGLGANPMIYIENKSNIILRNLTIQNLVINNAQGIQVVSTSSGSVSNLSFINLILKNISWTTNPAAIPSSSKNSQPFIAYGEGITQSNAITNIIVDSCEFLNNLTGFSESLSFDGNIDGIIATNNRIHNNSNIGILFAGNYHVSSVAALDHARNGKASGNICNNNISNYATNGGIYVDGAQDILIEKNICYHNGWGIEIGCEENGASSNIIVRNNLIYDNMEAGLAIGGYTTSTTGQVLNCTISNNSFVANNYSNSGNGEIYMTKASNCSFRNNVFYTNSQNILFTREQISPQAGNNFDYNCWFTPPNSANNVRVNWGNTTLTGFSAYKTASGYDAHSLYTNPLLVNASVASENFHLQSNSPCINAGDTAFVAASGETDFDGNNRVYDGIVDIGAYEHQNIFGASNYVFTGDGSWNIPSNWMNNTVPPAIITNITEIIIDPVSTGECFFTGNLNLPTGSKITLMAAKKFRIN